MLVDKIKEILELHKLWLDGDSKGIRFDLRDANLRDANLRGVDLRGANLRGVDLRGVDLRRAEIDIGTLTGRFHHISNIGSENGTLELYEVESTWFVKRGCFSGTLEEFLHAVEKTHGDNPHGIKYKQLISVLCK